MGAQSQVPELDTDTASEEEGPELSVLEYARLYGLAVDHQEQAPRHVPHSLRFDHGLSLCNEEPPSFEISPASCPTEKLCVSRDAFVLLSSILRAGDQPLGKPIRHPQDPSALKLDLPLLKADPDIDILRIGARRGVDLLKNKSELQPWEKVDHGEMVWMSQSFAVAKSHEQRLDEEQLLTLNVEQTYLNVLLSTPTIQKEFGNDISLSENRPATPILLPTFSELFLEDDWEEVERNLSDIVRHKDRNNGHSAAPATHCSLNETGRLSDQYYPIDNDAVLDQLQFDSVPLEEVGFQLSHKWIQSAIQEGSKLSQVSPTSIGESPTGGLSDVKTSEILSGNPENTCLQKHSFLLLSDGNDEATAGSTYFEECFNPLVEEAKCQSYLEKCRKIDQNARFELPKEVEIGCGNQSKGSLLDTSHAGELFASLGQWKMTPMEHLRLRWTPFNLKTSVTDAQEEIVDEIMLKSWIPQVPSLFPGRGTSENRDGKDVDQSKFAIEHIKLDDEPEEKATPKRKLQPERSTTRVLVNQNYKGKGKVASKLFETFDSIDNFCTLKTSRHKKIKPSEPEPVFPGAVDVQHGALVSQGEKKTSSLPIDSMVKYASAPRFVLPSEPGTFVASTSIINQRALMRRIGCLYPTARWVEVDLALVQPCTERASPDMLFSPTSALLLTSLTSLHQRALPGTSSSSPNSSVSKEAFAGCSSPFHSASSLSFTRALSPLQQRVIAASQLYSNVLVLVAQRVPQGLPPVPLVPSDESALKEFGGWLQTFKPWRSSDDGCSNSVATPVCMHFCPGGESDLAQWVVAMMVKYGENDWTFEL